MAPASAPESLSLAPSEAHNPFNYVYRKQTYVYGGRNSEDNSNIRVAHLPSTDRYPHEQ